jgi:hypothetical protein
MAPRRINYQYNLEGYITGNFVIYTGDLVLLGKRNQGGYNSWECSADSGDKEHIQNIGGGTSWKSVTWKMDNMHA